VSKKKRFPPEQKKGGTISGLDPLLVGRMMYVKENLMFLQKHCCSLRKKEMSKDLHHLVDLEFNYLIAMDEYDEDIDISKNDHLLDF
jgi:hypothetical protein